MASMMHICSGLVGPKSGNVEKVLVFKAFLKDSMVQNTPHASSADLAKGSGLSLFEVSNLEYFGDRQDTIY